MDIRLAEAMLLDRPFDVMQVELGYVGDFFEGQPLKSAGLQVDDLIGGHGDYLVDLHHENEITGWIFGAIIGVRR